MKLKNKWGTTWPEKVVSIHLRLDNVDIKIGDHIRKIDVPGKATCQLCSDVINYGQKGVPSLKNHLVTSKHKDKLTLRRENYAICVPGPKKSTELWENKTTSPIIPIWDRVVTQEAMVLGTLAEHQLPFTIAPVLIDLAKKLGKDPKALSELSMARTTASYKMQHGLAETYKCETTDCLKHTKFSLNMDESTSSNLHRVLTVLVSYFKESQSEVVVEHLCSSCLIKVDSQSIFTEIDKFFTEHEILWENLASILMDSCSVMRGSKTGFETRVRESQAGHLLDIDGNSCHHIHNTSKYFCKHFEHHIEGLHSTIFNDFKWSSDLRDTLNEICFILNVKFTMADKMVPHRWLSCYIGTVSNKRMFEAYTIFYYAFLTVGQKVSYQGVFNAMLTQKNVSASGKEHIRKLQHDLSKKKMTEDGKKRKDSACSKIFKHRQR